MTAPNLPARFAHGAQGQDAPLARLEVDVRALVERQRIDAAVDRLLSDHDESDVAFARLAREHPEACSCDDDYPGWAAHIAALTAKNRQSQEAGMTDRELPGVPAGPLSTEPAVYLSHADGVALLTGLLEASGVELGAYDQRIVDWLAGWDGGTVMTVASLLRRAAEAGGQS